MGADPRGAGEPSPKAWRGPVWSRALLRAVWLPIVVTLPLASVAPQADERYNVYRFGAQYSQRPWGIVVDQIDSIPTYLFAHGNFRPLGRMLERVQDTLIYQLSGALQLPMNVALRFWYALSFALLGVVLVGFVQALLVDGRSHRSVPTAPALFVPVLFAPLLVGSGGASSVLLFGDLYSQSAVVVLGVALLAMRARGFEETRVRPLAVVTALVVGSAMAAFNEIAYTAAPLAVCAVLARGLGTVRLSPAALLRTAAIKLTALGLVGFTAVFVPIRRTIAVHCGDGDCYSASAIELSSAVPGLLAHRVLSWVPPLPWRVASEGFDGRWYVPDDVVLPVLVVLFAVGAVRAARDAAAAPTGTAGGLAALASLGAAVLLLPAAIAALSEAWQEAWREGLTLGTGWRDTTMVAAGGAVVLAALVGLALRRRPAVARPAASLVVAGVATVGAAGTIAANAAFAAVDAAQPPAQVQNRIALAMTEFGEDPADERWRCGLLEEMLAHQPERPDQVERLQSALNVAAEARHDASFCDDEVAPDEEG